MYKVLNYVDGRKLLQLSNITVSCCESLAASVSQLTSLGLCVQ